MSLKRVKTYLVTGGAGFLGSHLCHELLHLGHRVICLDNFSTGSEENIAPLKKHSHFQVMAHDICAPIFLEVDAIYNLACPASPKHYQKDPIRTMRICVEGVYHLLELARQNGAKILQASTSEVYGDPLASPQKESYRGNVNPIGPRACYDEGKRCAETLFFDYKRRFGLDIKVARIFNTYGPNMQPDDGRVVSNFIVQALKGKPLTVYGEGTQTRSFCYVDDLIMGLMLLMESSHAGPINLGNPEELTVLELAKLICKLTGSKSEVHYAPLPEDDPLIRRPDISLAQQLLGWKPLISLEEGVMKTISYTQIA